MRYTTRAVCSDRECGNNFYSDHWGNKEAARLGWFLQRNGQAWCPEHIPEWVAEWREKKRKKAEGK